MSDQSTPPNLPPDPSAETATEEIKWPKVIAILNIVFGILGTLTGVFGFFAPKLSAAMMKLSASVSEEMPTEALELFEQSFEKWAWATWINSTIFLISSVFLLLSGIACLKLKKVCRPYALVYFGLNLVYMCFLMWLVFGTNMVAEQSEAALALQPQSPLDVKTQTMVTKASSLLTAAFYLVYPVFLLIWFYGLKKIKEHVQCHFS